MAERFDYIVLGAGINGAGTAQKLVEAGHRVLLIDKAGVGDGTSSRSSRLIHGGLRYLESGYLHLVGNPCMTVSAWWSAIQTWLNSNHSICPSMIQAHAHPG